jgi:hypothetical protein
MSINLLEAVQKNLGYPPLTKIDPNTAQVTDSEKSPGEDKFSQAAIPAVLTALHEFVQSDEGAAEFLKGEPTTNWVSKIFDEKRKEAVQTIAAYAEQSKEDPIAKMNAIANEAVKVVKENIPADATAKDVKTFFETQIGDIVLYLLPGLHMGELLNHNTLDDNTNKMEGPVSNLIKNIGAAFSTPVMDEEILPQQKNQA